MIPTRLRSAALAGAGMAALLASLPAAPGRAASPAVPEAPVFGEPVTVDAQRLAGEPDVTLAADGRRYVSAPWGTQTNTSFFWRSEDGGESYRQIQAAPGFQNPYLYKLAGDTEMQAAGPSAPGRPDRIYFANQAGLDSNTCGYSDDAGRSWQYTAGIVCPQAVGSDREWLAHTRIDPALAANGGDAGHDIEYLWYDHLDQGFQVVRSDDGQSYSGTVTIANTTGDAPGNTVADPRTGVVYLTVSVSGADANHNGVLVAWSADGGRSFHSVDAVPRTTAMGTAATDFTVLAMDSAGNLYLAYSTQGASGAPWQTWMTHTTGFSAENSGVRSVPVAGATPQQWSRPVPITGPGSARPDITHSVFPWVTAGDPGRVDIAFYGTSMPLSHDPNTQDSAWSTYVAQSLDALDTAPRFATARASSGHSHLHSICFQGVGCTGQGNRNMLDFFEVGHDARGAAVVAYNDDANSLQAAFPGGPFDVVSTQVAGPGLFAGVSLTGAPAVASSITDRAGDGFLPTDDTNHAGLDLLGVGVTLSDPQTLRVSLHVADLSAPVSSLPPQEGASGVTYLVTWKWNDDLWYAAAHVNAAGAWTCDAGRPQSVPFTATGGPKFAVYALNANATTVPGAVDAGAGTIVLSVPASAVGGVSAADTLRQVTAFTLADRNPAGVPALSDQADATAPFADPLGSRAAPPAAVSAVTPVPGAGSPTGLANTSAAAAAAGATAAAAAVIAATVAVAAFRRRRTRR